MVPTQDHNRIREWALKHNARPAQLQRLKYDGQSAHLTFVFGVLAEARLEIVPISWEMFFAEFDLLGLSMAWDEDAPLFDIVKVEKRSADGPLH